MRSDGLKQPGRVPRGFAVVVCGVLALGLPFMIAQGHGAAIKRAIITPRPEAVHAPTTAAVQDVSSTAETIPDPTAADPTAADPTATASTTAPSASPTNAPSAPSDSQGSVAPSPPSGTFPRRRPPAPAPVIVPTGTSAPIEPASQPPVPTTEAPATTSPAATAPATTTTLAASEPPVTPAPTTPPPPPSTVAETTTSVVVEPTTTQPGPVCRPKKHKPCP